MLPTKENGEITTIENVFHSLNTRLNKIKNNTFNLGDSYSGYEYNYEESINDIETQIYGFSPQIGLNHIKHSLKLVNGIKETLESLIVDNQDPIKSSLILDQKDFDRIASELNYYQSFLEKFQADLFVFLDATENNAIPNLEKIRVNISVEKLGALIYFLNNERDFTHNVKIFKADLTKLCNAFITILCKDDGNDIKFDSLYNSVSSLKHNEPIINFWKDKFITYVNQSIWLLKK